MRRALLPVLVLLLPAFVSPIEAVPAPPASCVVGALHTVDVATGSHLSTAMAPGTSDPEWEVLAPFASAYAPGFAIEPHLQWATPPLGTRWIGPSPLLAATPGGNPAMPPGTYTWRFAFDLDLVKYEAPRLVIRHGSDESTLGWTINGVALGGAWSANPPGATTRSLSYGGPAFVHGRNVLSVEVDNLAAHTGLLVSGGVTVRCVDIPAGPPCAAGEPSWWIDLTTGRDLVARGAIATGADDDDWRVESTPTVASYGQPARAIPRNGAWVADPFWARWVNPWPAVGNNTLPGGDWDAPAGTYVYAVDFHVNAAMLANVTLDLLVAADNAYTVTLNSLTNVVASRGADAYRTQARHTLGPSNPGAFVLGQNTLYVHVGNLHLYTGLLVEGRVFGSCVPVGPCTFDEVVSTGVDAAGTALLSPGDADPRWTLASQPSGAPPQPGHVVNPIAGWAVSPQAGWISPTQGGNTWFSPAGTYEWELAFASPCVPSNCAATTLDLRVAADDLADVTLNGQPLVGGATPGALATATVRGCPSFQPTNVLRASVVNDGNDTALLVIGRYHYP